MMSRQLQVYAVISRNHPQFKAIQGGLNRDLGKLSMTRAKETSMKTSATKNIFKFLKLLLKSNRLIQLVYYYFPLEMNCCKSSASQLSSNLSVTHVQTHVYVQWASDRLFYLTISQARNILHIFHKSSLKTNNTNNLSIKYTPPS